MAITHKTTDQSLQQLAADTTKESTVTAGQAGIVVINPDGSNVGGGGGSGGAVTIADGANVSQGAVADTAYTTGSGTMVSILKGIFARLRGGQATMANSLPVTLASDQASFPTLEAPNTAINTGRTTVTTAGTRVTLAVTTACKRLLLTALSANTGTIVVGGAAVVAAVGTRQGTPLLAGDTFELFIDDLNKISIDSTVNGEGVSYTYFV